VGKLILMSIMVATVAAGARAARAPNPVRGLRRLLIYLCLADAAYLFAVTVVYHRL
jgi:hypothetical protein